MEEGVVGSDSTSKNSVSLSGLPRYNEVVSQPKVFIFWTWEDKLSWITEELRAGRLRQGWGGQGTALTDDRGRLLSFESWLIETENYFSGWEDVPDRDRRHTRYSILKTMVEMEPGDLVVVPRVPTGDTFTVAVVAGGYSFDGRHFGGAHPVIPSNDLGHVVEVETTTQRVFSISDPDAALIAKQFRNYRRAVNAVRANGFANQIRDLFAGEKPLRVADVRSDYSMSPFSSDPQVLGGQTVMTGTRVPLRTVLASLAEGDSFEEILRAFPSLRMEHLKAAVRFAARSALEDQPTKGRPEIG